MASALEVFAANDVNAMIDERDGYTPTPVVSQAILTYNRNRKSGLADEVIITPSHNPPEGGGFKYNPPNGGPADTNITTSIEHAANALLEDNLNGSGRLNVSVAWSLTSRVTTNYLVQIFRKQLLAVRELGWLLITVTLIGLMPLLLCFWCRGRGFRILPSPGDRGAIYSAFCAARVSAESPPIGRKWSSPSGDATLEIQRYTRWL